MKALLRILMFLFATVALGTVMGQQCYTDSFNESAVALCEEESDFVDNEDADVLPQTPQICMMVPDNDLRIFFQATAAPLPQGVVGELCSAVLFGLPLRAPPAIG